MNIAVVGFDVEGEASLDYYHSQRHTVDVYDESDVLQHSTAKARKVFTGPNALKLLAEREYDLVLRTPGLPPSKLEGIANVTSATNEFLKACPAPIIGVTGTKGKGTTCSMIKSIADAAGKTAHLVGNIGTPALSVLSEIDPQDVVVYEMSSFQLWDVETSPQVAVILGVEADHLDRHKGFDDYVQAKSNIRKFQTADDTCYYLAGNDVSKRISEASDVSVAIPYADERGSEQVVYVKDDTFYRGNVPLFATSRLSVPGAHNVQNACAAIAASYSFTDYVPAVEQGLQQFQTLPHHIELVRVVNGVEYYDDSFSSAPSAAEVAIQSFNQPVVVIIGGVDKGADFSKLVRTIAVSEQVKKVIIIGQVREKLARMLQNAGVNYYEVVDDQSMGGVIAAASKFAGAGEVVLLSPGCASFDMFKNFYDRGDQFQSVVRGL